MGDRQVEQAIVPKDRPKLPDYLDWAKVLADYLVELGVPDHETKVRATITNVRRAVRERRD